MTSGNRSGRSRSGSLHRPRPLVSAAHAVVTWHMPWSRGTCRGHVAHAVVTWQMALRRRGHSSAQHPLCVGWWARWAARLARPKRPRHGGHGVRPCRPCPAAAYGSFPWGQQRSRSHPRGTPNRTGLQPAGSGFEAGCKLEPTRSISGQAARQHHACIGRIVSVAMQRASWGGARPHVEQNVRAGPGRAEAGRAEAG